MASQSYHTSLSSWLSTMKADDIDDGLAADFDGSLSGLGVELGSSTYNMSEALLALPVYKQENLEQGFQYVLSAATSPATKLYEETVTYLNQGQSYEIKVKKIGSGCPSHGRKFRSVVRVIFHDRRLQYNEKEQLDFWMQMRPGERIVDVDVPLSYGVLEVKVSKTKLNCIELIWDPEVDTGIYIKIHAISTEFTPRKHGGEKGVPFRVQLETYLHDDGDDTRLLHGASCQVKVFKPKGADRKHKTDREKIEKRSDAEKEKYQPSYDCTVLTEIPLDQIKSYLSLLEEQENQTSASPSFKSRASPSPVTIRKSPPQNPATIVETSAPETPPKNVFCIKDLATFLDQSSVEPASRSTEGNKSSAVGEISSNPIHMETLSPKASAQEVSNWLKRYRFDNFVQVFQNFAGADLLRLTRDDLTQICGLADGIRLDNALQSRSVRPKLTIYVCQSRRYHPMVKSSSNTHMEDIADKSSLSSSPSTSQDVSPQLPSPSLVSTVVPGSPASTVTSQDPSSSLGTATASKTSPFTAQDLNSQTILSSPIVIPNMSTSSSNASTPSTISPTTPHLIIIANKITSNKMDEAAEKEHLRHKITHSKEKGKPCVVRQDTDSIAMPPPEGLPKRASGSGSRAAKDGASSKAVEVNGLAQEEVGTEFKKVPTGGQGWKRQYRDEVDSDDEVSYSKKLRTRTLELSTKGVYHAVYLEVLTLLHLREKMSSLFSISSHQILEIHVQGPSGIHILVTDNVVQNFPDQTRYNIETYEDDVMLGFYKIMLHSVDGS